MTAIRALILCWAALASLAAAQPAPVADKAKAMADAFEYAQLASLSQSSITLNTIAARTARGAGPVAILERRRDALEQQQDAAVRAYEAALSDPGPEAKTKLEVARRDRERLVSEIAAIAAQVRKADPAYWDLIRPDALSLKAAQALLNPDEALLFVFTFETATYSFALTATDARWHRSALLSDPVLAESVRLLRSQIAGELTAGYMGAGFDPVLSAKLYSELIAPLDAVIGGKRRLLSVVSGPLAALPLQLLVSGNAEDAERITWLADTYRVDALASVAMLRSVRCLLADPARRHPGCSGASGRTTAAAATTAMLTGFGDPVLGPPVKDELRGANEPAGMLTRGVANRGELLKMPSLPGSRRELEAIAQSYGAARSQLFLGPQASEINVRRQLGSSRARFVIFSTHGVLASEIGELADPGLVLTPPPTAAADGTDDGYLSASEVTQLNFAGASIVLSACNTATVETGSATRNLQSLARAFQFAGARNVIASHWSVSDEATAILMSRFFATLAANPGMAEDEALYLASKNLRADPDWRSPAFWAPFSIIGVP